MSALFMFSFALCSFAVITYSSENIATAIPDVIGVQSAEDAKVGVSQFIDPSSRKFRIALAKNEILRKLGMKTRPPHMDGLRANIPKPVFDGEISSLFSSSLEPEKTTQIVIPAEEGDLDGCEGEQGCFSFHLKSKIFKNQAIVLASLQFFKSVQGRKAQKIRLEDNNAIGKSVAVKRVPVARDWFSFHVEQQIGQWTKGGKSSKNIFSFKITCEDCVSKKDFRLSTKPRYRPFLLVKTSEKNQGHSRKRRSFSVECIPGYNKCCRQSLYVSFKEIGWQDWIIEPAGFEVNFCKGRCSGGAIDVAKSHGFVKKELMKKKKNGFLSVCCVPTKFGILPLLHFDREGFIFKTSLSNMVVQECGCM